MISIDYKVSTYTYTTPWQDKYWHHIKLTTDLRHYWDIRERINEEIEELRDRVESMAKGQVFTEREVYSGSILFMFTDKHDFFLTKLMV
ncbi:hypothetical protein D3C87_587820 [compost metagenome]